MTAKDQPGGIWELFQDMPETTCKCKYILAAFLNEVLRHEVE
jgi:hypothetical protein